MASIQENTIKCEELDQKNISYFISYFAKKKPQDIAIIHPYKSNLTFLELEKKIQDCYLSLMNQGVQAQDKVLVFMKPSLDFYPVCFALLRLNAVIIFIDPGMRKKLFKECLKSSDAKFAVGLSLHLFLLNIFFPQMSSIKKIPLRRLLKKDFIKNQNTAIMESIEKESHQKDMQAAIVFTSGGTGDPKGVQYTQKAFLAQRLRIGEMFHLDGQKDVDLSAFPLFSLISLTFGVKTIIPPFDVRQPGKAKPDVLYQTLIHYGVTFASGSPAIWHRLGNFCENQSLYLPKIRALALFGAPVRLELHHQYKKILSDFSEILTPYGATECLPVSVITGQEILAETEEKTKQGLGVCVGYPASSTQIMIANINNGVLTECQKGQVGEVLVSGDQMTLGYIGIEKDESKIIFHGVFWHRMGDIGYLDDKKRLWFCGRKAHRVVDKEGIVHDSICAESGFLAHPEVAKAALIKWRNFAAIVIERKDQKINFTKKEKYDFFYQLLSLKNVGSKNVKSFFIHPSLPVDTRHNIKIDRLALGSFYETKNPSDPLFLGSLTENI